MARRAQIGLCLIVLLFLSACASSPPPRAVSASPGAADPSAVVQAALAMQGTPYRYGGASPRGFDCSGLVYYAHRQAGFEVPRTTTLQYRNAIPVDPRNLQPGDLVFFRLSGKVSHVGLYIGNGEFVHAPSSGKHVSTASLDNPYWRRHLTGAGRLVGD